MTREALIVEDDSDIARLVQLQLRDIDCEATIIGDGEIARQHLQAHDYDLLILDLMLPGCDGLQICRELRSRDPVVPILMLTAKAAELDRVLGLEMGADDYLAKPFSQMELSARIKALFRRAESVTAKTSVKPEKLQFGDLVIDLHSRRVNHRDQAITLTAREFDLLVYFASNPDRVYTRAELLAEVWGYQHSGYEHTVNTHINRLRRKLDVGADCPDFIKTVWGVGYQFDQGHA